MKKIILLGFIILIYFSFLYGCDEEKEFRYFCSDNINLIIENPTFYMDQICYDEKGMIDMLILNNGKTQVVGFNFFIYGENENRNITLPLLIHPRDAKILSLNIPLKTIGEIDKIEVTPNVIYNNETVECSLYKLRIKSFERCY